MNIKRIDLRAVMQRVPGAMLISSYLLLLFGAAHVPFVYCFYLLVLHVVFLANNFRYGFAIYAFYRDSVLHSKTDWISLYKLKTNTCSTSDTLHDLPFASVLHVIVIPNYNEHFHTLCETLDVLASHHLAISQYRICLAMELNEPGSLKKALQLESIYSDLFFDITHTMHPNDIPNEIRGKSSNVNWAVRQMAARGSTERHGHQIVTVMDADTTFAQDYFTSVTYHFSTASIADRKIMMFCGGIIFDRNADDVPALVRVFDLGWAVGIMSNLYQSSSIKVPCSSYSISMDLCIHVDFWDTTAEAMGEDCHMYLKCFYSTQGRVIVKTIFSPVSVLNVQVSEKGFIGQFKGIYARYVQALRHLWASLDTGYMLRRSLLSLIAPQYDLKINGVSQQSLRSCSTKDEMLRGISFYKLFSAFHRIMEAHTWMCQVLVFIIFSYIIIPTSGNGYIWSLISSKPVESYVLTTLAICSVLQKIVLIPNIMGMYYYYYYHKFVSFERWVLQDSSLVAKSLGQNATNPQFSRKNVTKSHRSIKVQPLGKRPELFARPRAISFVFEFAILPVPAALLFYVIPQAYAQLSQIFTNQLDYKVSEKEIGASSCGSTRAESLRLSIDSNGTTSKNSDEGFCESDYESMEWGSSKISRNASGEFYGA